MNTIVTNRDAQTRDCSLVTVVVGAKSEDVIDVLQRIDEETRCVVEEVTLDLSDSTRKIVRTAFPKASRVIDRFLRSNNGVWLSTRWLVYTIITVVILFSAESYGRYFRDDALYFSVVLQECRQ